MNIKILSYNIHKGFDWRNRNYFLKEMKEFIRSTDADIVFLQEVIGKSNKLKVKGLIDSQFEFLADEIWPHFSYAKNSVYDHGHHGNLILSKFPIESYENIDLSTNSYEKRGLLLCKITLPETGYFYAACSHLNLLHNSRIIQYEKIKNALWTKNIFEDNQHIPIILAGDFNDWNKQCENVFEGKLNMKEAYKYIHGSYAKSFPAIMPILCLDRIYIKNFTIKQATALKPTSSKSLLSHLSDHLPLFCEVESNGT